MNPIINRIQHMTREAVRDRPDLTLDILESMQLTVLEIEDGGSPEHELELFTTQLNQLKGNQ